MLPLSTGNTKGCNPISSNCIVWQGPDLACLNLCTGDTISVVIAKIAELVCNLIQAGVESSFDISNILQGCTAVGPNPEAEDLNGLLQNTINTLCNLSTQINGVDGIVETITELTELIDGLELNITTVGNDGEDGTSVVGTVDNGDGTFYFVFSDGTDSSETPIDVPTDTTIEQITNEINNTVTNTIVEQLEVPIVLPKCFFNDIGRMTDETGDTSSTMGEDSVIQLYTNNPQAYLETLDNGTEIYYNGWLDFVTQKLCCLLALCADDSSGDSVGGEINSGITNRSLTNFPVITQLKNRVLAIEKKHGTKYVPPKVTVKCVIPNKIGQRVEMQELLQALEKDYCAYRKAIGSTGDVLAAARYECSNLSSGNRLAGNGVMSTVQGWNARPSNLAQSFSNAWRTICDLRTAVEDLQTTVTPTACTGFVYDPKASLIKSGTGDVTGVSIRFDECTIPKGYYDCDKARGTKITVEDASLNTIVSYANVSNLQSSVNPHNITIANTQVDTTSNFKIKIHFCFTDGTNQCERLMDVTLENSSACPTVALTTTGETSIEYTVSGLNTTSNSIYDVIVQTTAGSLVSKQAIKNPTSTSIAGKATGLIAGTKYNYYVEVTNPSGNVSSCPKSTFVTSAASCATVSKTSSEYITKIADVGTTKVVMATYKNGSTVTAWIAGFEASTGSPVVYKGTDSTETGGSEDLTFVKKTKSISDNPTTSISCGNVVYSASNMTTSMNSNENGWQYVDVITANGNTNYYIYALVNTNTKSIDQVVFCCDCKPSYVRPRYGKVMNDDGTYNSNSNGYRPEKHSYYVVANKDLRIPIDIVGYSTQTTPIVWEATGAYGGTTKFYIPSDSLYDKTLGGDAQLIYTPNSARPTAGFDSVKVYAKTDCTVGNEGNRTVNTVCIPIQDAAIIPNKDTNITVFIDGNVFNPAEALVIKNNLDSAKNDIKTLCPEWSGIINYVPVAGKNSADYLEYTKAMVDMKAGGTGSVTIANGFDAVKNLPSYWSPSSTLGIPSTVYILAFIGDVNLNGNYGSARLADGWNGPAQPTPAYQKNYDELQDILNTHGTAAKSVWGAANDCNFKQFNLKQILIPVVSGSQDNSAAAVLQTMGALTGTILNTDGYSGLSTGSVKNPVNLADYLGPNASMVPYTGTTSYASNTINGLYTYGFRVASFIDKSYLTTDSNIQSSGDQSNWIQDLAMTITGVDTAGLSLIADRSCPTGVDIMKPMTGTLNGSSVVIYGENTGCRTASTTAQTASNCIPIYNSTGVMFDTSVKAYKSINGGNANATSAELVNTKWYAQQGATSTDKVRRVAQYNSSGTGGYWLNIKYVDDASCV
jgi:hypothetical protein